MTKNKVFLTFVCLILCTVMLLCVAGCSSSVSAATVDLMSGITADKTSGKSADDRFILSQSELAVALLKSSFTAANDKNMLISPLSVSMALSMTANGANGKTAEEMQAFLGNGITLDELNKYQRTYLSRHNNPQVKTANSIWFKACERFKVNDNFLKTNANYYNAGIFKAPFDSSTVKDINTWTEQNTDGLIEKIIDKLPERSLMSLINAVSFDAEWQVKFKDEPVRSTFKNAAGRAETAFMMKSVEGAYLESSNATGFIKKYDGAKYSFAALLPNEGISIKDYISSLNGEELLNTLKAKPNTSVEISLPKFSYEYSENMTQALSGHMPSAFDSDNADFSNLGVSEGNIYIGEVLHKTNITVDTSGTKAAASTIVNVQEKCSIDIADKTVTLDRPFVYMIIDNQTKLPIFIGTVMSVK